MVRNSYSCYFPSFFPSLSTRSNVVKVVLGVVKGNQLVTFLFVIYAELAWPGQNFVSLFQLYSNCSPVIALKLPPVFMRKRKGLYSWRSWDWTEIFKPSHLTLILLNLTGTLTQSSSSLYSYIDILHQGIVNLILTILSSGLFKERSALTKVLSVF